MINDYNDLNKYRFYSTDESGSSGSESRSPRICLSTKITDPEGLKELEKLRGFNEFEDPVGDVWVGLSQRE